MPDPDIKKSSTSHVDDPRRRLIDSLALLVYLSRSRPPSIAAEARPTLDVTSRTPPPAVSPSET